LKKCEPHIQEAFHIFEKDWTVVQYQGPTFEKVNPETTIYDLPRETYEGDAQPAPEVEQEDELLIETIGHPKAHAVHVNAQKRVCSSPYSVLPLAHSFSCLSVSQREKQLPIFRYYDPDYKWPNYERYLCERTPPTLPELEQRCLALH